MGTLKGAILSFEATMFVGDCGRYVKKALETRTLLLFEAASSSQMLVTIQ